MANYIYTNGKLYNADELAHAHKYIKREYRDGKWRYYYDFNDGDGWSNKVGVETKKNKDGVEITAFNTKADKYWVKNQKARTRKLGGVKVEEAEDGTAVTLNISTKKIKALPKNIVNKGRSIVKKLFKIR